MNYKVKEDKRTVMIQIPKNVRLGYVNNTKVLFAIALTYILGKYGIQIH